MQCNIQNSADYCILDQLHFQDITKLDMLLGLLDFAVGDYMHKTPMTTLTPIENMSVEKKTHSSAIIHCYNSCWPHVF